ncbi:hypothetical protein CMO90_01290 [Candidatus Woesearchaeota archaeon]|nr:hypothetical protein [Candidatus Woesearchaeota archaeon]|tara:strand:+ start:665 stop:1423 length:759 start_codon:yes stop_codon:yes gene_type:complete
MKTISFKNKEDEKLSGLLSKNNDSDIVIVLSHGFLSDKFHSVVTVVSEELSSKGFNTFIFDFSGNGESEGLIGDSSYIKEQDDLVSAIDFLENNGFKKFCLIGHSMGGGVSIITASIDKRVKWLVDLASPGFPEKIKERRFNAEKILEAYKTGSTSYEFGNEKTLKFNKKFFEDLEKIDIFKSIKKVKMPLLIVHGTKDLAVDLEESEELFTIANNPKTIKIISGADHCFSDANSMSELLKSVNKWVLKWVK